MRNTRSHAPVAPPREHLDAALAAQRQRVFRAQAIVEMVAADLASCGDGAEALEHLGRTGKCPVTEWAPGDAPAAIVARARH